MSGPHVRPRAPEPSTVSGPLRAHALDLSIIIVNWNTRDLLANCLQSVYDTVHDLSFEVFVVDNASSDGSAAMVRERFPQVRLIENDENVGFARANNQAIALSQGEYVLLLNPDTVVLEGTVEGLCDFLSKSPDHGAVGAQLLNDDGSQQFSGGAFPTVAREFPLSRFLQRLFRREAFHGSDVNRDWACGACLLVRKSALDLVGALDEDYWLYGEELDWCYRARQNGLGIAVAPRLGCIHRMQAASSKRLSNSLIMYQRSRALFYRKNRSTVEARLYLLVSFVMNLFWMIFAPWSPIGRNRVQPVARIRSAYRAAMSDSLSELLKTRWSVRGN